MASLYQQTIPVLVKYLRNLSGILEKGAKHADQIGMKHEYMLNFRLVHDMRGLPYQVQSSCNTAKFLPARLGVMENKYFEDDETTFEQLQERITKTIELLQTIEESSMDGLEAKPVIMETRSMGNFSFSTGQSYVDDFSMPNFYFHITSAYCILRHLGVPLGALDYLGKDTFVKAE